MHYAVALQEIIDSLVKGMKLLARLEGGEGRGTKVVDKIGLPVICVPLLFLVFCIRDFSGILGGKKMAGN